MGWYTANELSELKDAARLAGFCVGFVVGAMLAAMLTVAVLH